MTRISDNLPVVKELRFRASALADLRALPVEVRRHFGHALWQVQNGETPANASPFELSTANEVMKLTEQYQGDTYRCVYAAKFEKAVYVLHAFKKKSTSGIATPKKEIERVYSRLKRATADYQAAFPSHSTEATSPPSAGTTRGRRKR